MHNFLLVFISVLLVFSVVSANAEILNYSTNKSLFHEGDTLIISGNVSFDPSIPFVTIQIFTPGKSNFADFNTIPVKPDGSFSAEFNVGGPTWTSDGIYPIKVTYGENLEKSIEYKKSQIPNPPPKIPSLSIESKSETKPSPVIQSKFTTLKFKIPGFPSYDKSPQYYIDRYNAEPNYKSWFDSQFPKSSIYNILGYDNPVSVPDWIRINAEWWASGKITDSTFITGIEFMLENNIIIIPNLPNSNFSGDEIPDWIRNNAHWWSQDLITEDEFVNSLKFLIEEGIIIIN